MKINRIYNYFNDSKKIFGIISAFDNNHNHNHNHNYNINSSNHQNLKKDIRKINKGYIEISGTYDSTFELSLLIPNINIQDIISLGKKYNQNSIIFKDNKIKRIDTKNNIGRCLKVFEKISFNMNNNSKFNSQILKGSHKRFKFHLI